ncbi:MAG: substrate-binding domain-containing protein [Nocardiopsaceae bacterium]|nr:substrate-binding domain-containing protein [Nocardiopsaceae bacterium]
MSRRLEARIAGVAAVAVAALGLAACSSGSGQSASGKNLQLIVGNASDPFYVTMECGAKAEASKLGVNLKTGGPPSFTVPGQKPLIDDAAVTKPNALLVAPTDASKLDPDLQRVQSAGSKIVFVDTSSSNKSLGVSRITSDNVAGGKLAADKLGALVGGKGTIAVLSMAKGTSTTDARVQGFDAEMKAKFPKIKLLPEQTDVAATTTAATSFMESDIVANPKLAGVFTANTVTAQGAAAGLQHAGKSGKIKMATFDAEPQQMQAMKSNTIQIAVAQDPYAEGQDGVEQAVNALNGKHVTASINTPLAVITPQNMNSPSKKPYIYKSSC